MVWGIEKTAMYRKGIAVSVGGSMNIGGIIRTR